MSEVGSEGIISENIPVETATEDKAAPPWWEGRGKQWKLDTANRLGEITTGKELLEKYPEMTRDELIQLKTNLLRKGSLHACDAAVELIIGALGTLAVNDLDPSTYPEHLLDPHYKANVPSGTLLQPSRKADF